MQKPFIVISNPEVNLPPSLLDREELQLNVALSDPPPSILLGAFNGSLSHMAMFSYICAVHNEFPFDSLSKDFRYTMYTTTACDTHIFLSFTLLDAYLFVTSGQEHEKSIQFFSMFLIEMIQSRFPKLFQSFVKKPTKHNVQAGTIYKLAKNS